MAEYPNINLVKSFAEIKIYTVNIISFFKMGKNFIMVLQELRKTGLLTPKAVLIWIIDLKMPNQEDSDNPLKSFYYVRGERNWTEIYWRGF